MWPLFVNEEIVQENERTGRLTEIRTSDTAPFLLTVFWDGHEIIHQKHLLKVPNKKNNVTGDRYAETFNLQTAIKKQVVWDVESWSFWFMTTQLLIPQAWVIYDHPPYSPDLAPFDFELFAKIRPTLDDVCFKSDSEVEEMVSRISRFKNVSII